MSVGCAGLLRSAFGRPRERTDARRFSLPRAIPRHLVSAEARAERARLAAGLQKVPLRPPRAGYVHVQVTVLFVYSTQMIWGHNYIEK